jgi:NADPH:quinone reductase-like Zn-dependent oxidoreductase
MGITDRHIESIPQTMMTAATRVKYGPVNNVQLAQVPRPEVTEHAVLVKVHAAGLDRGVWHLMTGLPYVARLVFGLRKPKNPVLGMDFAGTVVALGASVTRFNIGDEVHGVGKGTFAEYTVAKENNVALKPTELSFTQAAVVPTSAVTALQALRKVGNVQRGQAVLITGASGGVGTYAVQLAKAFGAEVTAVASTSKLDLARSLGADHVLDYTREDFDDGSHHYDLILDIAGNPSLTRLRRALTPTGTVVIVGGENNGKFTGMNRQVRALALSPFLKQRMTTFTGVVRPGDLEELNAFFRSGAVTPALEKTYPLEQVPLALEHLIAGKVRGKVGITL